MQRLTLLTTCAWLAAANLGSAASAAPRPPETRPTPPPSKAPPRPVLKVDAGKDKVVEINKTIRLAGSVNPKSATVEWTKLSGPGPVTFGDPTKTNSTVRFRSYGDYELQLKAKYGTQEKTDRVCFTVPQPALVNAGADMIVEAGADFYLSGTVSSTSKADLKWTGPKNGYIKSPTKLSTLARVSGEGFHVFTLTADNGTKVSDEVVVKSFLPAKDYFSAGVDDRGGLDAARVVVVENKHATKALSYVITVHFWGIGATDQQYRGILQPKQKRDLVTTTSFHHNYIGNLSVQSVAYAP